MQIDFIIAFRNTSSNISALFAGIYVWYEGLTNLHRIDGCSTVRYDECINYLTHARIEWIDRPR